MIAPSACSPHNSKGRCVERRHHDRSAWRVGDPGVGLYEDALVIYLSILQEAAEHQQILPKLLERVGELYAVRSHVFGGAGSDAKHHPPPVPAPRVL